MKTNWEIGSSISHIPLQLLTDHREVNQRVPRGRLVEVDPAAVDAGVGGLDVVDAEEGGEGLGAELRARAQPRLVGPHVRLGDAAVLADLDAGRDAEKYEVNQDII